MSVMVFSVLRTSSIITVTPSFRNAPGYGLISYRAPTVHESNFRCCPGLPLRSGRGQQAAFLPEFFSQIAIRQPSSMYRRESSSDPVCPACRKNMTNVRKSSISLPISVCRITGWKHIALLLFLPDFKIVREHAKPVNLPRRTHTVCVFVPPFYFICSSVKSLNWISVNSAFGRNPSFARPERYSKAGCSSADGVRNTNSTRFHSFEMGMLPFA